MATSGCRWEGSGGVPGVTAAPLSRPTAVVPGWCRFGGGDGRTEAIKSPQTPSPSQLPCLRRRGDEATAQEPRPRPQVPRRQLQQGPGFRCRLPSRREQERDQGSCAGGWLCGQGRQLQVLLCPGAPSGEPPSCHLEGCLLGHRAPPPPGTARPGAQGPGHEGGSWSRSPTGRVAPEAQLLPKEPPCPRAEAGAGPPAQTTDGARQLTSSPALGSAPRDPPWHLQPLCHLLPETWLRVLPGERRLESRGSGLQREQEWELQRAGARTAELDLGQPDHRGWRPSPASSTDRQTDRQTDGDSAAQEQQPSLPAPAQHPLVRVTPGRVTAPLLPGVSSWGWHAKDTGWVRTAGPTLLPAPRSCLRPSLLPGPPGTRRRVPSPGAAGSPAQRLAGHPSAARPCPPQPSARPARRAPLAAQAHEELFKAALSRQRPHSRAHWAGAPADPPQHPAPRPPACGCYFCGIFTGRAGKRAGKRLLNRVLFWWCQEPMGGGRSEAGSWGWGAGGGGRGARGSSYQAAGPGGLGGGGSPGASCRRSWTLGAGLPCLCPWWGPECTHQRTF